MYSGPQTSGYLKSEKVLKNFKNLGVWKGYVENQDSGFWLPDTEFRFQILDFSSCSSTRLSGKLRLSWCRSCLAMYPQLVTDTISGSNNETGCLKLWCLCFVDKLSGGGGGHSSRFWVGVCRQGLQTWTPF